MDQDIDYFDLVESAPNSKMQKTEQRRGRGRLFLIVTIIVLVLLLLGAGVYFLLPFLSQNRPAAGQVDSATATPEPAQPTVVAAITIISEPTAIPNLPPPTETPVDTALEALLPLPAFGFLLESGAQPGDQEERAGQLASDMAVREPYQWEYLEFDPGTMAGDLERYYIRLVNQEMGYKMTFNERYSNKTIAVFKFKQDARRITIQFFEGREDRRPSAFLFYEGE